MNTPCCEKNCLEHKYHCAKCWSPLTYSPANYASRPSDIPNPCMNCHSLPKTGEKEILKLHSQMLCSMDGSCKGCSRINTTTPKTEECDHHGEDRKYCIHAKPTPQPEKSERHWCDAECQMRHTPQPEKEKCDLVSHTPVWGGDGYFCSKCMISFTFSYPVRQVNSPTPQPEKIGFQNVLDAFRNRFGTENSSIFNEEQELALVDFLRKTFSAGQPSTKAPTPPPLASEWEKEFDNNWHDLYSNVQYQLDNELQIVSELNDIKTWAKSFISFLLLRQQDEIVRMAEGMKGEPEFYSYYVLTRPHDKKDCGILRGDGANCRYCGYWQRVQTFAEIPKNLQGDKNCWQKHWESERAKVLDDFITNIKNK